MLKNFKYTDGLFARYANLVCDVVVPYQEKALRNEIEGIAPSFAFANFKNAAILNKTGKIPQDGEHKGALYLDSDVAKWLEASAYSLAVKENKDLEKRIDQICDLIGQAQETDGYLDTYYTLNAPDKKFTYLAMGHELYCAGHMMEAAVAIYDVTGSRKLLDVMCKNADMLYRVFVTEKRDGYPGHPEIELALLKLWKVTQNPKYLELAKHFIEVRGVDRDFFPNEYKNNGRNDRCNNEYYVSHKPVREQSDAVGHAVRAVYLYTGMADLAANTEDKELEEVCFKLFESIEKRRMYITGGIGSTNQGEAFTTDYHLPNDTAYNETCASIALIFFGAKLLKLRRQGRIADVMERAIYNTVLAGVELDGKKFFYVNPLEVMPGVAEKVVTHWCVRPQRPGWFGCACCPPNAARLLASVAKYGWDEEDGVLYSNLFMAGELSLPSVTIEVETTYPFGDTVKYKVKKGQTKLAIHIPSFTLKKFSVSHKGELKDGYYYIDAKEGEEIVLKLDMTPRFNRANSNVTSTSGMAAVTVGPVVYCSEEKDNGDIFAFSFDSSKKLKLKAETPAEIGGFTSAADDLGKIYTVEAKGFEMVLDNPDELYVTDEYKEVKKSVKLIPYFMWANRGLNKMRVWMPIK